MTKGVGKRRKQATAKAKYRGLSTPLRSGRDDVVLGFEMTSALGQVEENGQGQLPLR